MDFTEIYKQTSGIVQFSPGTQFLLTAIQDRLVIRRADSFQIIRTWQVNPDGASSIPEVATGPQSRSSASTPTDTWITHAGWSLDSEYILAACAKKGYINVFKLRDETWNTSITCGTEGLVKAEWAPDGRSILCFSAWGLRVTVWSLVTGNPTYIVFPLHQDRGYAYRNDGRYFVLAERHKGRDAIGVYDVEESYRLVRHYPIPTASFSSLSISPNGSFVAIWDGPLEYKVHIFSLSGELQGSFCPDPDPGFGVKAVAWHPSSCFVAVAGHDDKIHIIENITWGPVAVVELSSRIPNGATIWREASDWMETTNGRGFVSYEKLQSPNSISLSRSDLTKPNPKSGILQLEFNITGTLLLARFESAPCIVFLYAFPTRDEIEASASSPLSPRLRSVLIHSQPVTSAKWNPERKGSLAIACGIGSIYLWSDEWVGVEDDDDEGGEIAECVGVPAKRFETRDIKWAPDGKGLVLLSKDSFCCAFEVEDADC
ncbi:WD repeat-containing protein 8 [Abortiporus biennis]|nr:WD repeat-containing protein 8 [Abortiporus biennis]